jgi:molybdopterin-guanine dinucleotide biosynthesis protein A
MAGAIILAGGENTRIGQNKALLDLGGQPLIQIITSKLSSLFENIYIVTNTPEEYSFLDKVNFVRDAGPGKNTLEAIYSGLAASKETDNFVCACDMPYLNIKLIEYLFKLKAGFDIVAPVFEYKPVALHTIYAKSCIAVIEKSLAKGNKKFARILRDLNVKYVPEEALITEDQTLKSFFHIKTYLDYMLVQADF